MKEKSNIPLVVVIVEREINDEKEIERLKMLPKEQTRIREVSDNSSQH